MQLEKGKTYRAELKLGFVEAMASNAILVSKFQEIGFTNVSVAGQGARRTATGTWSGASRAVDMPKQVAGVSLVG
jgi:hypothetical protein